jgi:hypothetical protein
VPQAATPAGGQAVLTVGAQEGKQELGGGRIGGGAGGHACARGTGWKGWESGFSNGCKGKSGDRQRSFANAAKFEPVPFLRSGSGGRAGAAAPGA